MSTMPWDNATYKFKEPCKYFHHSEYFWESIFALLLWSAGRPNLLVLPIHDPLRQADPPGSDNWFKPRPDWKVPKLEPDDIVVNGRGELASFINARIPNFLEHYKGGGLGFKPDLVVFSQRELFLIEVKTVGSPLSAKQIQKYLRAASDLTAEGLETRALFLMSSGHEDKRDHERLYEASKRTRFGGILLWEDIFQLMAGPSGSTSLLPKFLTSIGLLQSR